MQRSHPGPQGRRCTRRTRNRRLSEYSHCGCLNDVSLGARDEDQPLQPQEEQAAKYCRGYLKQFAFGQITWLGPGDEKVWSYSQPLKTKYFLGGWDRLAQTFMAILHESGHIFVNPRCAMSQIGQVQGGRNVHFNADTWKRLAHDENCDARQHDCDIPVYMVIDDASGDSPRQSQPPFSKSSSQRHGRLSSRTTQRL